MRPGWDQSHDPQHLCLYKHWIVVVAHLHQLSDGNIFHLLRDAALYNYFFRCWVPYHVFLTSADLFQKYFSSRNHHCQTAWIQIQIWIQTVCKGYQQTTLVDKEFTENSTTKHTNFFGTFEIPRCRARRFSFLLGFSHFIDIMGSMSTLRFLCRTLATIDSYNSSSTYASKAKII